MSTQINIDPTIESSSSTVSTTGELMDFPTILQSTSAQTELYKNLPIVFKQILAPCAIKFATTICKIDHLITQINELEAHITATTAPDFIIKQFKNILNQEHEALLKSSFIRMKLNHHHQLKVTQANSLIFQFNHRETAFLPAINETLTTIAISDINHDHMLWSSFHDYLLSLKLIEFRRKQASDNETKMKKKLLFNTKLTTEAIPVVITQKELKSLNNKIKNLELNQTRTRTNTKKKQANKPTTTSTSSPKPNRKGFQNRKQKKSPSVPPKPRNTRKRT